VIVLVGVGAEAWILALVAIRGRRRWLQSTFAACALSFVILGATFVGVQERILSPPRADVQLGLMLLAHALTAILVLGLIHGETLPRQRAAAFLLLVPVPVLAWLAPAEGWTAANASEGNVLGGFMVLCLGIALAETIYARYTSGLLATASFWLSLGVVSLIVAGPVYAYELEFLGQTPLAGANMAAPLALACFALVALHADPFPGSPPASSGRSKPGALRAGETVIFEETRPRYALRTAHEESSAGRATLILSRTPPPMTASRATYAAIVPGNHAALRSLTTASEFLASRPGGLVVLEDLAALSALSGWRPSLEAVVRLRHVARGTGSSFIVSTSRLTNAERDDVAQVGFSSWILPEPATEIESILAHSFGAGATRLLESFGRAHGLRRDDITPDHIPGLLSFLTRAVAELSDVVAGPAARGLQSQFEAAASVLRSFAAEKAEDLARGKWPSRNTPEVAGQLLVTAADYWKGREMEELFNAAEIVSEREPLFERARAVFVEQLGESGESVLRSQLARLGKKPEELETADLVRIADRAAVDLAHLADVVDIPQEKERMQKQIESIRQRLELIVEDQE
jgi:hypothetical protein